MAATCPIPLAFFCFLLQLIFVFDCSRNFLGHRKDVSKEVDKTIVNHFHGVSSSSEAHRDVCGQTDPGSWITDMVSIMVNKNAYKPSLQGVMDKYYEMFRGKNNPNKTDFFNRTEDEDTDV